MTPPKNIDILFVAGFGPIVRDPAASRNFYANTLNIPFKEEPNGYLHTAALDGVKHFALWPLSQAAQSCFGTTEWPANLPIPQAWLEFDVRISNKPPPNLNHKATPTHRHPNRTLGPNRHPPPQPRRPPRRHNPLPPRCENKPLPLPENRSITMTPPTQTDTLRYTKIPLNTGSSSIPAVGFGTLIPDPVATEQANQNRPRSRLPTFRLRRALPQRTIRRQRNPGRPPNRPGGDDAPRRPLHHHQTLEHQSSPRARQTRLRRQPPPPPNRLRRLLSHPHPLRLPARRQSRPAMPTAKSSTTPASHSSTPGTPSNISSTTAAANRSACPTSPSTTSKKSSPPPESNPPSSKSNPTPTSPNGISSTSANKTASSS